MNGKKILNRLVIVFIIINLLLFGFNISKYYEQYSLSDMRVENILTVLEEEGIQVEAQLPRLYFPKTKATLNLISKDISTKEEVVKALLGGNLEGVTRSNLIGSNQTSNKRMYKKGQEAIIFDGEQIIYTNEAIAEVGAMHSPQEIEKVCETFLKRISKVTGLTQNYKEYNEGEPQRIVYYPLFKGIPVFDLYIEFKVYEEGVRQITMKLGLLEAIEEQIQNQEIYPIDVVLFGVKEYLTQEKPLIITNITLGYSQNNEVKSSIWGEQVVPVYKIELSGLEKSIFVNAYTNEVLQ